MPLGRGVDRPVLPPAQRASRPDQQHHLDEAPVRRAALDLVDRQSRRSASARRWRRAAADRGPATRCAIQSFTARAKAAPRSSLNGACTPYRQLQMASRVPNGSSASAASRSTVVAGLPSASRQSARDGERVVATDSRSCSDHRCRGAPPFRASGRRDTAAAPATPAPSDAGRSRSGGGHGAWLSRPPGLCFSVVEGAVPGITTGRLPRRMAGTSPAMTGRAA